MKISILHPIPPSSITLANLTALSASLRALISNFVHRNLQIQCASLAPLCRISALARETELFFRNSAFIFAFFLVMAMSIMVYAFPLNVATQSDISAMIPERCLGRRCSSKAALVRTPLSSLNSVAIRRELGFGSNRAFSQVRRRVLLKAHEKDEGGVDDAKSFYATSEFWIQIAVVILTFGFVDAGYSGDWSRIGALSPETEAQLRTAAYLVVPISAVLVWVIGKRKETLLCAILSLLSYQ